MRLYFGIVFTIVFWVLCLIPGLGQNLGKISVQFDQQESQEYNITGALLYQNVSLDYDTTSQIQEDHQVLYLFYPQFKDGTDNVLRLIMARPGSNTHFYDLFINLGDSLKEDLVFEGNDSLVFWGENGRLLTRRIYSKQIRGKVHLNSATVRQRVTGNLSLEFDYGKILAGNLLPLHISVNGNFDVPVGKFREASITTVSPTEEQKAHYRRNLYVAIIISAILVAIFGFK